MEKSQSLMYSLLNKLSEEHITNQFVHFIRYHVKRKTLDQIVSDYLKKSVFQHFFNLNANQSQEASEKNLTDYVTYMMSIVKIQNLLKKLSHDTKIIEKLEFNSMDCNESLEQALFNLKRLIGEKKALVTYDSLPSMPGIYDRITQLFENLVKNSLEFQNPLPPMIHISCINFEETNIFTVDDDGKGIIPHNSSSMFLKNHTGLNNCHEIIKQHEGKIWFETKLEPGARVCFSLPE